MSGDLNVALGRATGEGVLIIHESGAVSHYRGLEAAAGMVGASVTYAEFSILRMFAKSVLRCDTNGMLRCWQNFCRIVPLIVGKRSPGIIVLGIAPFDPRFLLFFLLLKRNRVYIHSSWPHWDLSFHPHPYRFQFVLAYWRRMLRSKVAGICFVTEQARSNCDKSQFKCERRRSVVYHAYNEKIYNLEGRNRCDKGLTIGYVGRLEDVKGVRDILELTSRPYARPVRFKVMGAGSLSELVRRQAIAVDNLEYHGFSTEERRIAEFYRSVDILLLPSKRSGNWEELFGMVLIEGMACGVFPVASNHIGPREIILDAGIGVLVEEGSFVEDACRVIENFPSDLAERRALASRAAVAVRKYEGSSIAKRWLACFGDVT